MYFSLKGSAGLHARLHHQKLFTITCYFCQVPLALALALALAKGGRPAEPHGPSGQARGPGGQGP